jgi:2'-5' RNA ligase
MSHAALAIWLLPGDPRLQRAIDALSAEHGAPGFPAHLTLLGSVATTSVRALEPALASLAAGTPPLTLAVAGPGESEEYFETAFVRCAETPALSALRARVLDAAGSGHAAAIGPHVSLIYAALPQATRLAIAQAHAQALVDALRFDALALVASGPLGWRPAEAWRVLARHSLRG